MLRPSIQGLHTKFQPNWLKNAEVMHVFHFQAGRLVGWQAGLAGQHAKIFTIQKHMLSPSIQRLYIKFQPNWLKMPKLCTFFTFWQAKSNRINILQADYIVNLSQASLEMILALKFQFQVVAPNYLITLPLQKIQNF